MKFLIVYSSSEGHTRKIAEFVAAEVRARNGIADVFPASAEASDCEQYDAVVVAASIHAGTYGNDVIDFVTENATILGIMPSAFFSVGLSITSRDPEAHRTLAETTSQFLGNTRWKPMMVEQVAGALLYSKYGFIKKMLIRSIMKKAGGDTDTSRDYVYTDWAALKRSVAAFAAQIEPVLH